MKNTAASCFFIFFYFFYFLADGEDGPDRRDAGDSGGGGGSTHQCIAAVSFLSCGERRGRRWRGTPRVDLQRVTPPPRYETCSCQSDRKSSPERISRERGKRRPDSPPPACHQFCQIRPRLRLGSDADNGDGEAFLSSGVSLAAGTLPNNPPTLLDV